MRGPASVPTAMQAVCFSLVTFLLTANAYKFTTLESSLVGSPEYPIYIRMVIRFFNHPYSDFSDSEEKSLNPTWTGPIPNLKLDEGHVLQKDVILGLQDSHWMF